MGRLQGSYISCEVLKLFLNGYVVVMVVSQLPNKKTNFSVLSNKGLLSQSCKNSILRIGLEIFIEDNCGVQAEGEGSGCNHTSENDHHQTGSCAISLYNDLSI